MYIEIPYMQKNLLLSIEPQDCFFPQMMKAQLNLNDLSIKVCETSSKSLARKIQKLNFSMK
jgi:hypothetical protein